MKEPDNLTETRNSTEPPPAPSLWARLRTAFCPCLLSGAGVTGTEQESVDAASPSVHSRSETNHSQVRYHLKQTLDGNENVSVRRNTKRMNSMEFH